MKKLVFILLLLITTISTAQEAVLLRLNYEKGDVYTSKIATKMDVANKVKTDMTIELVTEVLSIEDDVYTIKANFERVTMIASGEGKSMNYDSNQKESDMDEESKKMHERMKPMTDAVISMKVDKKGNVLSAEVIEGGEDYQYQDTGSFISFPEEKVTVDSTWKVKKDVSGIPVTYEYKVISIKEDKVEIEMIGAMDGLETQISGKGFVERKSGNMNPMHIKMVMDMFGQKMITDINSITIKQ